MRKEYDLVIVGAGPAGAMAAKTAAENGLTVALLERKKEITQIRRSCAMMWLAFNEPYFGDFFGYNRRNNRLCFPTNGFSIKYSGPHKNLYAIHIYSLMLILSVLGTVRRERHVVTLPRSPWFMINPTCFVILSASQKH